MSYTDEKALVIIALSICAFIFIIFLVTILREILNFEADSLKRVAAFIPRLFIKIFKIKHKHHYICTSCGDGGLAGSVASYECIWCGDTYIR